MPATDPFLAEIALFPFTFAPRGWAFCYGQIMPISQNTALFALLGTTYGGDGKSTFALPDLNGRVPLQQGQGQGLSNRWLGETGGNDTVPLLASEIPAHAHTLMASGSPATSANPVTAHPATTEAPIYHSSGSSAKHLQPTGGNLPHNNLQPYLTLHYAICLQGIFPPRP